LLNPHHFAAIAVSREVHSFEIFAFLPKQQSIRPGRLAASEAISARHFWGLYMPSSSIISTSAQVSFLRNPHHFAAIAVSREVHSCEIFAFLPKQQSIRPGCLAASGGSHEWTFIVGFGRRWRRAQGRE
jgi:hypothetical protein